MKQFNIIFKNCETLNDLNDASFALNGSAIWYKKAGFQCGVGCSVKEKEFWIYRSNKNCFILKLNKKYKYGTFKVKRANFK